ncbi:DUF4386 domain-containing protein [Nocardiopsis lambiniae]|uniref:DUF4386 domain-containing protein n=1 Tax=Nocardiopsis lambiniae TaxID=3075539 RepID=A0ABU2M2X6_9ACTN|nr:DUF4386 domain-containing protein [Nocardiopsis sp. DSM 44743]MDT0326995.1 DUF4386 domain-containing protein [Nocardiopsis sp. DSM 44743]
MSHRNAGRLAGALFLAAFLLYGGGSAFADNPLGLGLMLLNSAAVATIGIAAFRALREAAPRTARVYLAARALEAVLLALGTLFLASGAAVGNDIAYGAAMLVLSAGSIPFCRALATQRWVPRWFAWWGVLGYALLAVGAVLEFAVAGSGVLLAVPGGLFEIAFGLFLLRWGFPEPADRRTPGPVTEAV